METLSLVLLIFGYLAAGFSALGLVCWAVIALVPDMRGEQKEAFHGLGRFLGQGLGIGLLSIALALLSRALDSP